MKKTLLITGRNGFIGSELTKQLKNKFNVISIIRGKKQYIDYSSEELILADINEIRHSQINKNIDLIEYYY